MSNTTTTTREIFGPFRLSYLNVITPRVNTMNNSKEYGALLLLPKEPTKQCPDPHAEYEAIKEAIKLCALAKFGDKAKGIKSPLKDGDKELMEDGETPKYPGCWVLRVSCREDYPPVLIDGHGGKVYKEGVWVSGDWGKVKIRFWAYDQPANKGVSAGLRAIQFLYKDVPLANSYNHEAASSEFGKVEDADKPVYTENGEEYDPFAD